MPVERVLSVPPLAPCLDCPLPDCDEANCACPVRRLYAARMRKARAGLAPTPAEAGGYADWINIWKLNTAAARSEAQHA